MHPSAEVPKLPKLPFIAGDAALLGLATFIALRAPSPFAGGALVAIVVCVALGAVLLAIPFVADYGRKIDLLLTERQDQIAALARTTSASAEQVSIAAVSLHAIAETSAKSARSLDTLPLKLQEKIAEFKLQLNEVSLTENEALEQELQTLRSAESDRLQTAIDDLAKTARELSRLETISRTQAAAAAESAASLGRIGDLAATRVGERLHEAAGHAKTELETAFAQLRAQLQADVAAAQGQSLATWNGRVSQAMGEIESHFDAFNRRFAAQAEQISRLLAVRLATPESPASVPSSVSVPVATPKSPALPTPVPTADPPAAPSAPAKPRVKPAPPPPENELGLDLPPPTPPQPSRGRSAEPGDASATEPALSSDGATRLLVTAYIGIGNKLFVRGSGPGLSWDKGVPLQFVSIGRWRWESSDATDPVAIRLYKNDTVECTTVGTLELEPGHQHEVTATF